MPIRMKRKKEQDIPGYGEFSLNENSAIRMKRTRRGWTEADRLRKEQTHQAGGACYNCMWRAKPVS